MTAGGRRRRQPPPLKSRREAVLPALLSPLVHQRGWVTPAWYVRVRAPMSIANVGPGFDHFGLCLERPFDVLEVWPAERAQITVRGDPEIPLDPNRNVATVAARAFAEAVGEQWIARARLTKGCPGGSGLGSSAASAVAGALAAAAFFGRDPGKSETAETILRAAALGEAAASGTPHLDNVSASLFGRFTLVEQSDPPVVHRLDVPAAFRAVVALPSLRVDTRRARRVLPLRLPTHDAVANVARASALVHGLLSGDLEQVGRNLVDRIAEPYREALVPGLARVRQAALGSGALGVALSGSGPAIWALARPSAARAVARAMREAWEEGSISCTTFVGRVGGGAQVLVRR